MTDTSMMQVPAHIAQKIQANKDAGVRSALTAAVLGEGGPSYPRVSIRASKYRLVEDGVETPVGQSMDVVIVGVNPALSKVFFDKPFDGTDQRPACGSDDGIKPSAHFSNPIHSNCATCPNNVLGSKVNPSGAKSKLCADQKHLAVVPAHDPSKVYGMTLSVSALKPLREYVKFLSNYGASADMVITEMGFDDNASFPLVTFKMKSWLTEKALPVIEKLSQSEDVKIVTRVHTGNDAPALAAPVAAAAPQIAAPEPVRTVTEEPKATVVESHADAMEKTLDDIFAG